MRKSKSAVVEFCRNVLKWEDSNSAEFDAETKYPVVISMPEHHTVSQIIQISIIKSFLKRV